MSPIWYKRAATLAWIILMPLHVLLWAIWRIGQYAEKLDNIVCWPHYKLHSIWQKKENGYEW